MGMLLFLLSPLKTPTKQEASLYFPFDNSFPPPFPANQTSPDLYLHPQHSMVRPPPPSSLLPPTPLGAPFSKEADWAPYSASSILAPSSSANASPSRLRPSLPCMVEEGAVLIPIDLLLSNTLDVQKNAHHMDHDIIVPRPRWTMISWSPGPMDGDIAVPSPMDRDGGLQYYGRIPLWTAISQSSVSPRGGEEEEGEDVGAEGQ